MKKLVLTGIIVGTLIFGGITFAESTYSKKGNEFICFTQIVLDSKDHNDGKCDICNKTDLFGMVKAKSY